MEAVAFIALGFALWIISVNLVRKRRRRDMDLPPLNGPLPRREKDWRSDAPAWSRPRYYGSTRQRP